MLRMMKDTLCHILVMFKWRHMVLHNLINTGLVIGLLFEGTYLKQCYQIIHVIYWYSHDGPPDVNEQ